MHKYFEAPFQDRDTGIIDLRILVVSDANVANGPLLVFAPLKVCSDSGTVAAHSPRAKVDN